MPGLPFPGDSDHYPARDELAGYLRRYAEGLGVEIRTGTQVTAVQQDDNGEFIARDRRRTAGAADGRALLGISDSTAFFNLAGQGRAGHRTQQIFSNPSEKATEDYITGRFG